MVEVYTRRFYDPVSYSNGVRMKSNNEMSKRIALYIFCGESSKIIKFKALMSSYFEETFITIDLCIKQIIPAIFTTVCGV